MLCRIVVLGDDPRVPGRSDEHAHSEDPPSVLSHAQSQSIDGRVQSHRHNSTVLGALYELQEDDRAHEIRLNKNGTLINGFSFNSFYFLCISNIYIIVIFCSINRSSHIMISKGYYVQLQFTFTHTLSLTRAKGPFYLYPRSLYLTPASPLFICSFFWFLCLLSYHSSSRHTKISKNTCCGNQSFSSQQAFYKLP